MTGVTTHTLLLVALIITATGAVSARQEPEGRKAEPAAAADSLNSRFFKAVSDGDLSTAKKLLEEAPALVSAKGEDGGTALHVAVQSGNDELTRLLLAKNADANAKGAIGRTPLHVAAYYGNAGCAQLLVAGEADASAVDDEGVTPLHDAAISGSKQIAELLLKAGAEVDARANGGTTPLHLAAFHANQGGDEVLKLLLSHKAEVNAQDEEGNTALHLVIHPAATDRVPVRGRVELLLSYKADVNVKTKSKGWTPLKLAVAQKDVELADLLRKHGAKE